MSTGKIVTFYSFKGGVGRTMTLANLAFLAAVNGKRVLVMDWDLEAPGLPYYFRGLQDTSQARAVLEGRGILDILCQWQVGVRNAKSEAVIAEVQQCFDSGSAFEACVHSLIDDELAARFFPSEACLELISAGSPKIGEINGLSYEEALAQFSWPDFFDKEAGGYALEKLREWARQNYDLVLIDSRTGLADIAGVCTMQLPDVVALCFVMNQQNIDGISKVAGAIAAKRGSEVEVRVLPMRVARQESAQSADAQARAYNHLTRTGNVPTEQVQSDLNLLAVATVDNVSLHEALAPFMAKDPSLDPLTLNYLRIAKNLLGVVPTLPEFDQSAWEIVQSRLSSRLANLEYVNGLRHASLDRALVEIQQLIDGAAKAVSVGDVLTREYVSTLVEVSIEIFDQVSGSERGVAIDRILDLPRMLLARDGEAWRRVLIDAINEILQYNTFFGFGSDEIALREELGELLNAENSGVFSTERIENFISLAAKVSETGNSEKFFLTIEKILAALSELPIAQADADSTYADFISTVRARCHLLKGDWFERHEDVEKPEQEFLAGLSELQNFIPSTATTTIKLLRSSLHTRLALSPKIEPAVAADHAMMAMSWGGVWMGSRINNLARVVLALNDVGRSYEFCMTFLADPRYQNALVEYLARDVVSVSDLLNTMKDFANQFLAANSGEYVDCLALMMTFLSNILSKFLLRHGPGRRLLKRENWLTLRQHTNDLCDILDQSNLVLQAYPGLWDAVNTFREPAPDMVKGA